MSGRGAPRTVPMGGIASSRSAMKDGVRPGLCKPGENWACPPLKQAGHPAHIARALTYPSEPARESPPGEGHWGNCSQSLQPGATRELSWETRGPRGGQEHPWPPATSEGRAPSPPPPSSLGKQETPVLRKQEPP